MRQRRESASKQQARVGWTGEGFGRAGRAHDGQSRSDKQSGYTVMGWIWHLPRALFPFSFACSLKFSHSRFRRGGEGTLASCSSRVSKGFGRARQTNTTHVRTHWERGAGPGGTEKGWRFAGGGCCCWCCSLGFGQHAGGGDKARDARLLDLMVFLGGCMM